MKRILAAAAALSMLAAPVCLAPAHAASDFTGLSFQSEYGEAHPAFAHVFRPFFSAAKSRFPEKLGFRYFMNNDLFPPADAFTAPGDGKADFSSIRIAMFPGRCTLLGVVNLPGMCPSSVVGSLTAHDLIEKFPAIRESLPKGTVNFTTWASTPYELSSIRPVRSLDELKALRVIVWDAPSEQCMKALGAAPMRLVSTDSYLALSKGMADAVLCPISPVRSLRLADICTNHLMLDLFTCNFLQQANTALWESLPADMRGWLARQGGGKMALELGLALDRAAAEDMERMRKDGHAFHALSSEDAGDVAALMEPFTEAWRAAASAEYDASLVDEVLAYCRERSRLHAEELASGRYGL